MSTKKLAVVVGLLSAVWPATSVVLRRGNRISGAGKRTMTEVVEMLQGMLDTNRQQVKDEKELYSKYKCYCDENEKTKSEAIEEATKTIAQLGNEIEELLGGNGELSIEVAKLKADMDKNTQVQTESTTLRGTENAAFVIEEADLQNAVTQLGQAIDALAAIGADQLESSTAHSQFMAGYDADSSLVSLRSSIQQALLAAKAVVTPAQERKVRAFLQVKSPSVGGAYSSQSGEVVGILKSMKETFESNLVSAQKAEAAAVTAHGEFIATKQSEFTTLETSHDEKVADMGTNDGDLATKKPLLASEKLQKESDIAFLEQLTGMCEDKAKEWDERKLFHSKEDAAISEAIALLNSDLAFGTFGKVAATSTGATSLLFLQTSSIARSNLQAAKAATTLLQDAARKQRSKRLATIARLLMLNKRTGANPFTKVIEEIAKMKELIEAEAKQDSDTLAWCNSERELFDGKVVEKGDQITALEGEIDGLKDKIEHPETGLLKLIADNEEVLETNVQAQKDQTEARRAENKAYREDVRNCQDADGLLAKAIEVLEKYYKKLEEDNAASSLVQDEPSPPPTWDAAEGFKGQSETGNQVITMLKFIHTQTQTEETTAHENEVTAQHAYEDSMTALKTEHDDTVDALAGDRKELATAKLDLAAKREDLDATEEEKIALERYLKEIKPGCDFITTNFDDREASRTAESGALDNAKTLLEGTPAFAAAAQAEKEEGFGDCKEPCKVSESHVDCKSCLAKVTVVGYCAGHPTTAGCPP